MQSVTGPEPMVFYIWVDGWFWMNGRMDRLMEWMVDDRGRGWQIDEWTDKAHYVSAVNTQVPVKAVCVWSRGWREVIAKCSSPSASSLFSWQTAAAVWNFRISEAFRTLYFLFIFCVFSVNTHCKWAIVCSQYLWSVAKSLPATIVIITADCPYTPNGHDSCKNQWDLL